VIGWYLVVSLLHGFWNLSGGLTALLVWYFTAQDWQVGLLAAGRIPVPTPAQVHLYTVVSWALLVVVSVVGILCLRHVLAPLRALGANPPRREQVQP